MIFNDDWKFSVVHATVRRTQKQKEDLQCVYCYAISK